jgi:hypothetical protein
MTAAINTAKITINKIAQGKIEVLRGGIPCP